MRLIVRRFFIGLVAMGTVSVSLADLIRLHNVVDQPLYAALYQKKLFSDSFKRVGAVTSIAPLAFSELTRPSWGIDRSRYLAVATSEAGLGALVDKDHFDHLASIGIGTSSVGRIFSDFYVLKKQDSLKLYSSVTLTLSDIKQTVLNNLEKTFDAQRLSVVKNSSLVIENPYKDTIAHVRVDNNLCDQEIAYLIKREPHVKEALQALLQQELNGSYIPKIAFISSGGGMRALTSAIGFHLGAQEMGLLDALTYDVGLSGGAWFVALWMYSGLSVQAFKEMMQPLVQKDLMLRNKQEAMLFAESLLVRLGLKQPVTLVNSWGALLANRYLAPYGDKRHQVLWSDVAERIQDGLRPFPILTAVSGNFAESLTTRPIIPWYEFTPYEVSVVGHALKDASVPTWAFGRTFNNLVSIDSVPAYDLGLIMGICGSAFAFSFARGYEKKIQKLPIIGTLFDFILSQMDKETIGKKRITVGKVPNFAKGYAGFVNNNDAYLKMVDAGIAFNLPYPPVSGASARSADVFIFCDASGNIEERGAENLYLIEQYARAHHLKFPHIDVKRLHTQMISVFKDESDPTVPLVIYISRSAMPNVDYPSSVPAQFSTNFSTAKFAYSQQEFDALSAVTQTNMLVSKERIVQELLEYIQRNGGF